MTRIIRFLAILFLALACGSVPGCRPAVKSSPEPASSTPRITKSVSPPEKAELPEPLPPPPPAPVTWADYDRVVALYVDGMHAEVQDLLARVSALDLTPEQRRLVNFLGGINAAQMGRIDLADGYLLHESGIPPSLAEYALFYRGQALFKSGRHEESRKTLGEYLEKYKYGRYADQSRLMMAEALSFMGRPKEAVQELKKLDKTAEAGAASLVTARIYEAQGRTDQARSEYHEAMEKSSFQDVRAEAAHKYEQLLAPKTLAPGNEDQKLAMVQFLRTGWRLDEALALIDRLHAQGGSPGYLSSLSGNKASVLFYSGRIKEALPFYQNGTSAYTLWMKARCLDRLERYDEALKAYQEAAKAYGNNRRGGEARLQAGLVYLRLDKPDEAAKAWAPLGKSYQDFVLWQFGLYHFRKKQYSEAEVAFKNLADKYPRSEFAYGAQYWRARSLEASGRRKEAKDIYLGLADSRKDYYYRMLAEQRLGRVKRQDAWTDMSRFETLLAPRRPELQDSFNRLASLDRPTAVDAVLPLKRAAVGEEGHSAWALSDPGLSLGNLWQERTRLASLTLPDGAAPELAAAWARLKDAAAAGTLDLAHLEADLIRDIMKKKPLKPSPDSQEFVTRLFAFSSAYLARSERYVEFVRLQYKYYRMLLAGRPEEQKDKAIRRLTPLAFPGQVFSASREFNIHPALILAIMRTESNYQPDIISVANARGLMQILPSTGKKISAHLGEKLGPPNALFTPKNNVRYGGWYISALIKEFDGQIPLAVASYNGGPFNVKRWVNRSPDMTLEEFVETIPFKQTRQYVKKVLGAYYQYRLQFAEAKEAPNLDAPLRKTALGKINF